MSSDEVRQLFLMFYEAAGHTRVPSASLVPSSYDPSVLLTTAGMQPFKPYFQGQVQPPNVRLASCQKCFRTPDIDQVGNTARHLTFFEMLGNFSFGDYFKQSAIEMAWELLTGPMGIDPGKLWATVHAGDASMQLGIDDEAVELWAAQGVPRERIVPLGDDNFWKAGPTGPCGPCSEIYYDRGVEHQLRCPDPAACKPGCDCDRYLEFYNLVFMQYDRDEAGLLTPLPRQNIDTGMGLERTSALLQGNVSVFEIDSFREIIEWAERASGRRYGQDAVTTKALRVLCDHGRSMTFLASDGVMPSNEGRGYVLRRIVRRAIVQADRIGLYKGSQTGVLEQLSQRVVEVFGDSYPELATQRAVVVDLLGAEEERFLRTLEKGSAMLGSVLEATAPGGEVAGEDAFQLYDTHGFPFELTEELAAERSLGIGHKRFHELMHEQRERARAAAGGGSLPVEAAAAFVRTAPASTFVGYETLAVDTTVTAMQQLPGNDNDAGVRRVLLKLECSPFYAEGGGQVGDAGSVTGSRGRATVDYVMRFDADQVLVAVLDGELAAGDEVRAQVDPRHRLSTVANHTATHLLHRTLRKRLGDHVHQAGSLVAPDRLRFDFTHSGALSAGELADVERMVNDEIARAEPVTWRELGIDAARDQGAMMLFGEKYGDTVRMVEVGNGWSRELCGGTHVSNTSEIRLFVITAETSVAANTRRIEAFTGEGAAQHLLRLASIAQRAATVANVEVDRLPDRVDELTRANRQLERQLVQVRSGSLVDDAIAAAVQTDGINVVAFRAGELNSDELLELGDRLKGRLDPAAVLLGSVHDGKVVLVATMSDAAVAAGMKAGDVIREAAAVVGGKGGGRPNMARGGGQDASRLDEALDAGRSRMVVPLPAP